MANRRGVTLLEVLVALLLLDVALLALAAARHRAALVTRRALEARAERAAAADSAERAEVRRTGTTLAEVLVALVLVAVILAAAMPSAAARRADAPRDARRLAADAAELLVRELREGVAPRRLGDTAVDLQRIVAAGWTCRAVDGGVGVRRDAPGTRWRSTPRDGDVWLQGVRDRWDALGHGAPQGTACDDGTPAWRPAAAVGEPGRPVRVLRAARWVTYRDAAGDRQLGLREALGAGWDVVQPVVGPFEALQVRVGDDEPRVVAVVGRAGGRRDSSVRVVRGRNRP